MKCGLRASCFAMLVLVAAGQPARANLPEPVHALAREWSGQWQPLGQGEMRWLGLSLYRARLWVGGERFVATEPFALALTYSRDIGRDRLVETTIAEMRRLGGQEEGRLARWREDLRRLFPEVRAGETLIGVHLPGQGVRFFHGVRPAGEIADADFARAFFAIWLDPRTRAPELRERLLGQG
jgi:hypothetical protein